jgi:hypothetical protein
MKLAVACSVLLASAIVYAQTAGDVLHIWTDSFDAFKKNIRVLDSPAVRHARVTYKGSLSRWTTMRHVVLTQSAHF